LDRDSWKKGGLKSLLTKKKEIKETKGRQNKQQNQIEREKK